MGLGHTNEDGGLHQRRQRIERICFLSRAIHVHL